jgi:hypothetical protein
MYHSKYRREGGAGAVSLAAMFTAFTLLFLYLAAVLPAARLALYFVASIFVMGIVLEGRMGLAFLSFAIVSLLGFALLPDKMLLLPYVLFFGHYGIGKYFIEKKIKRKWMLIWKLGYFNAALLALYFLPGAFLPAALPFEMPIAVLWAVMQVFFLVYDTLFSKVTLFYSERIRNRLRGNYY